MLHAYPATLSVPVLSRKMTSNAIPGGVFGGQLFELIRWLFVLFIDMGRIVGHHQCLDFLFILYPLDQSSIYRYRLS